MDYGAFGEFWQGIICGYVSEVRGGSMRWCRRPQLGAMSGRALFVNYEEADIGQSLYYPSAWTRNVCRVMSGLGIMFVKGILKQE